MKTNLYKAAVRLINNREALEASVSITIGLSLLLVLALT